MGKKLQPTKKVHPGQNIAKFFDKAPSQVSKRQHAAPAATAGPAPATSAAFSNATALQAKAAAAKPASEPASAPAATTAAPEAGPAKTAPAAAAVAKLTAKQAVKAAKSAATGAKASKTAKTKAAAEAAGHKAATTKLSAKQEQQPVTTIITDAVQVAANPAATGAAEPATKPELAPPAKPEVSRAPGSKLHLAPNPFHRHTAKQRSASPADAAATSSGAAKSGLERGGSTATGGSDVSTKAAAAAAAAGPVRAPRFNPYIPDGRDAAQGMLMSQANDDIEVAWKPSPPKDMLMPAEQPQHQRLQRQGSSIVRTASNSSSLKHAALQRHGSVNSSRNINQQQQQQQQQQLRASNLGSKGHSTAAEAAAAAVDSADNMLQQVLDSLSEPQHQQQQQAAGLATPGGPRLRAFRNHSVVPPSTGNNAGTRPKHHRHCGQSSSAAPTPTAAAGSGGLDALPINGSTSTVRRKQAGMKRRDLLDLLDRVEGLVKRSKGSQEDENLDQGLVTGDLPDPELDRGVGDGLDADAALENILADLGADLPSQQQQQGKAAPAAEQGLASGRVPSISNRLSVIGEQQQQQCQTPTTTQPTAVLQQQQQQSAGADAIGRGAAVCTPEQQHRQQQQQEQCTLSEGTLGSGTAAPVSIPAVPADTGDHVSTPAAAVAAAAAAAGCVPATPLEAADQVPCEVPAPASLITQTAVAVAALGTNPIIAASQPAAAAAQPATPAVAAAGIAVLNTVQRRAVAARELEELELLGYDLDEDSDSEAAAAEAATAQQGPQQQQQQQQADPQQQQQQQQHDQPASKRQRLRSPVTAAASASRQLDHQHAAAAADVELVGGRTEVYHVVLEVLQQMTDVTLRCFNPYTGNEVYVHLSHPWSDCPIAVGDTANVIGGGRSTDEYGRQHAYIDHKQGMIIMHPDVLLSGTTITTALTCTRRAWLSERFAAASGGPSSAALRGTLLHELLQRLLVEVVGDESGAPLPGITQLQHMVHEVLDSFGEKLHEVGLTEAAAASEMNKHLQNISAWLRKYLPQPPQQHGQQQQYSGQQQQQQQQAGWQNQQNGWKQQQPNGRQQDHLTGWQQNQQQQQQQGTWSGSNRYNTLSSSSSSSVGGLVDVGPNSGYSQPPRVCIRGVADIEENIWAPRYGLKGQIDASLLVSLHRRQQQQQPLAAAQSGPGWYRPQQQQQQQQQSGQRSWGGVSGQQQHQQHWYEEAGFSSGCGNQVLGSGWSVAAAAAGSGGGFSNMSAPAGYSVASGSGRPQGPGSGMGGGYRGRQTNVDMTNTVHTNIDDNRGVVGSGDVRNAKLVGSWQQQQHRQQHQQQSSGVFGVLQQIDINAAGAVMQQGMPSAAAGGAADPADPAAAAAAGSNIAGVTPPTSPAAAGGVRADEPIRVFKGKLSGAVAATKAVQQSRALAAAAAATSMQHPQQQQQQQLRGFGAFGSAASGGPAAAAASGGHSWPGSRSGGPVGVGSLQQQQQQQPDDGELLIMPFEFKSGKEYFSHRAQVSLYLLLMEVRYQLGVLPAGLLWNVNSPNMALVPAKQEELAPLMACRNRLAAHLWQDVPTPPRMLGDSHACSRCHSAATCAAVHAVVEGGTASSSGMDESQWTSLAGAVSAAAAEWGRKWLNCIDWEEAAGRARRAEMWALTGAQRQAKGNCIAGLQYISSRTVTSASTQAAAETVYLYTFKQIHSSSSSAAGDEDTTAAPDEDTTAAAGADAMHCAGLDVATAVVDPVDAVVAECISASQQHRSNNSSETQPTGSMKASSSSSVSNDSSGLQGMPVAPGDVLILGADGVQVNIGRVEVAEVHGNLITVASHKALQIERYMAATSSAAAGEGQLQWGIRGIHVFWRLDRDEAASTGMFQRANVLRIAADSSSSRVIRLRKLLIELVPPKQLPTDDQQSVLDQLQAAAAGDQAIQQQQQGSGQLGSNPAAAAAAASVSPAVRLAVAAGKAYLVTHGSKLNADQVAVVQRVMQMQDYSLVLGMPGTGKTSTIVHAIRALASFGASILVTSYTNSALDNILLKLVECGVHDFVRLGRASSCHPGIRQYMPGGQRYPQRSTAELQQLAASTPIVGCPCLSVHHPLLAARPAFDVVIVDEAGQISLPAVLGALLKARSFVLVGDHYQLPPLVLDKRAAEGGLGVSLFRQLCEAHPSAVVVLRRQYRMCQDVMGLANELIYGGQLVAGSEQVENAVLQLPRPDALNELPSWASSLLAPSCRLALINTDSIQPPSAAEDSHAASGSGGVINAGEAAVILQLLNGLLGAGVSGHEIGIISPYKAQVALLQQWVDARSLQTSTTATNSSTNRSTAQAAAAVEVMTIDKCQGRDKAVLLLSFVRSNPRGAVGTLLNDWQRLNVAITRAKVKLLMVGSAGTLGGGVPLLQRMIEWVEQRGGFVSLPADAVQQHT